jgi:hypothetical protein
MNRGVRRPWVRILGVALILAVVAVAGFGLFLAGEAGQLPWQEDPTRIPITPFADIPGFGAPTSTSTPAPGS